MEILKIIALSLGSTTALFVLTKLIGYRQMSEMSMFDYINGITIGSIAAEMATSLENNFIQPLTAMIVYSLISILLSFIASKSIKARSIINGNPLVLLNNGELFFDNLKKAKIDLNEFLVQCRVNGYFDISKLEAAVLEENGKISFLPKSKERPITPGDLNFNPSQEYFVANIILDGVVLHKTLRTIGKDINWLQKQLHIQGIKNAEDVLLATCDRNNKVTVFDRSSKSNVANIL